MIPLYPARGGRDRGKDARLDGGVGEGGGERGGRWVTYPTTRLRLKTCQRGYLKGRKVLGVSVCICVNVSVCICVSGGGGGGRAVSHYPVHGSWSE